MLGSDFKTATNSNALYVAEMTALQDDDIENAKALYYDLSTREITYGASAQGIKGDKGDPGNDGDLSNATTIAIGQNARIDGEPPGDYNYGIAVGSNSESYENGVVIGTEAQGTDFGVVCVGASSSAKAVDGITIGQYALSFGVGSIAIGARSIANRFSTQATEDGLTDPDRLPPTSIAIGQDAWAGGRRSIVIGTGSKSVFPISAAGVDITL